MRGAGRPSFARRGGLRQLCTAPVLQAILLKSDRVIDAGYGDDDDRRDTSLTSKALAMASNTDRRDTILGVVILVVLILGGTYACTRWVSGPVDSAQIDEKMRWRSATAQCENAVRDKLLTPSKATFSGESHVGEIAGNFSIFGVVDTDNIYGATLRRHWQCAGKAAGDRLTVEASVLDE